MKTEAGDRTFRAPFRGRLAVAAFGLLMSTFEAAPATWAGTSPTITVGVSNCAGVPHWVLVPAEKIAKRVLKDAGIDTIWIDYPSPGAGITLSSHAVTQDLLLRIVSNGICDHQTCDQEMLGFALPCYRRKTACMGYVLYPRIETLAADGDAAASVIVGHVMAHEIGHLLLGAGHSPSGIMQARWNRDVLQSAGRDELHFTHEQSARLQAAMATGLKPRQAEGMSIAALSQ